MPPVPRCVGLGIARHGFLIATIFMPVDEACVSLRNTHLPLLYRYQTPPCSPINATLACGLSVYVSTRVAWIFQDIHHLPYRGQSK